MTIYSLTYSFPDLELVCCSMSSSNCCCLTCIQYSQEEGKVFCYSHLFKNFPQIIVIHTAKSFGIVNNGEVNVFLELSCFFNDPTDVGNLISSSSASSKSSLTIWKFPVHILLKLGLENFEDYFASVCDERKCAVVWTSFGIAFLWLPTCCLFYTWQIIYVNATFYVRPTLSFPRCVHPSILYICISIPSLQIDSSVSSSGSFSNDLQFSKYNSFTSSVRFFPKYLIL